IPLSNGNLALMNSNVDNPIAAISNAGAVTLLDGRAVSTGIVTGTNSVLGATLNGGLQLRPSFNATHQYLIIGSPSDNRVSIAALRWRLVVEPAGSGAGVVTSSPAGIGCGATCAWRFNGSQIVTLTATAALSSTFAGWSGACTGSAACVVTMDQPRAVIATFALKTFALTTNTTGTGGGSIGGLPGNAGALPWGAQVTLSALADANSTFVGWSGACSGTAPCKVTMTAARQVTAEFALKQVTVTLPAPSAGGRVTVQVMPATVGSDAMEGGRDALEAGSDAQPDATYPIGTKLQLTAVPNTGFVFGGWGGALSGVVNPQQVTVTGPIAITASFIRATSGGVYLPAVRR
ncbi:MAG: InlB B-repeat-containing protein, partial [Caldilineaceae bacterium]